MNLFLSKRHWWGAPAVALLCGCAGPQTEPTTTKRPNILLIVADDLGYGDIAPFGSEIETPNLDALASSGVRFTRFYSHVSCSPTRSLLMTGVDNHLNGLGTMAEDKLPHHEGVPGYEGYLNNDVVTVATLLRDAGYHTYMSGKWHLGLSPETDPFQRGFERSYALAMGGSNHFNGNGLNTLRVKAPYTENGESTERPDGLFSSDLFADKIIESIENGHGDGRPFFAMLSFTAPHWPLQAPAALIEKYADRYVDGWAPTRQRRFERLKEMGLAPAGMSLPPMIEDVPDWDALSDEERRIESKKMAIFAAMVDNLDANVGRVLDTLETLGESDNTLVVFMSDNGTDAYDRSKRPIYAGLKEDLGYDNGFDNMGAASSSIFYGLAWAQVGSVHHRYYKFLPSEGGMHVPMIARLPGVLSAGADRGAFVSALDLVPTFLELAGVDHPGTEYQGRPIHAPSGRSIVPYLHDSTNAPYGDDEPVAFEIFGHGVVYMGSWKAIRLRPPWENNEWRLFDLESDPGEQRDLAGEHPELVSQLVRAYTVYTEENGVIDEPDGVTAYPYKPGHLGDLIPESP